MPTSRATGSTRFMALMAVACWTLLNPHPVLSQTADRISTDRPDFVEAAATVGRGRIQVETGLGLSDMSSGGSDVTSFPSIVTLPPSGRSIPARMRSRVDLPHPEGPSREKHSPEAISRSMPFNASNPRPLWSL